MTDAPFTPDTEGVWFGLSDEAYRAAPGLSQTTLKEFGAAATPLHFATAKPKEQTKYMKMGTVGHVAILEGHKLDSAYHLRPDKYPAEVKGQIVHKDWHNGSTWCERWMADHADKPVLTTEEAARIPQIAASVQSLPEFSDALENGQKEVSYFRRDSETGLLLKCRCDVIATDAEGVTWIFDPKKVQRGCATAREFSKHLDSEDYGYAIQAASYLFITGASRFVFVPFDDDEPFDCCQFEPDAQALRYGWTEYRRLLTAYAQCVKEDKWPGYSHELQALSLPAWVLKREGIL